MRLQDKVAIVTGAATGIGRAIATEMVREGARVVIDYVGPSARADELAHALQTVNGSATAVAADVSDAAQVDMLVEHAVKTFGRIDIFVNNAGIEHEFPFLETPKSEWDKVIAVNNVAPGAIDTPMDAPLEADKTKMKALLDEIPLRRMGKPQEVAALCVFLASDAAAYITGSTYVIDGGMMRKSGRL